MKNDDWEKAKEIFVNAIKLAPELRLSYLGEVCGDDAALHREVESLLASHEATDFLDTPAVGKVAVEICGTRIAGKRLGHYKIIEQIGVGGMGEVYLAQDTRLDRPVAVKILNERFARHDSNLKRFIQEAKAASALNHPNILVIHEAGEDEDTNYIVSEFIKGSSLGEILRAKKLDLGEALDIAIQIVSALCAAHEARLVHRDIKPDNVMVRDDGIVKVLDFGLAKLIEQTGEGFESSAANQNHTAKGIILGTASYMSPEQARGEKLDARTDIFSFGCVLYEMLTGQRAFTGETVSHTIIAILEKEPLLLTRFHKDFPAEIERIVQKCLAKDLNERYVSAKDLLADLKNLKKHLEFETEFKVRSAVSGQAAPAQTEPFKADITMEVPSLAPHNLTEYPEPIVGREKETSEIKNLLGKPDVRLLTLTGVGGTGKTRLAQAIARGLLSDFPDGVFFVELSSVTNAELVAAAIAQPLGVKEAGGKAILEILKDYLRNKKMLLVLDNFEQVADAAPQIGELLSASRLKILITSRTLLRLSSETEFVIPPLAVPSEISQISRDEAAQYEAVKLFVERAQKAKPRFALTEENARSVAEICARLDGLPLAIELAATRVKILSPQVILSKLENRLQLLTGGARDLPLRQQTMRGTMEWSYELLSEDEKRLFRRLAVFKGGFTFEAAEAVCNGQNAKEQPAGDDQLLRTVLFSLPINVLDGITSLIEKSLLVSKEQSSGDTRFQMLEIIREYALDALEVSNEARAMRRAHAEYFHALGEEAEPHLFGDAEGVKWLNRLEEEHENLRAALEWALESSPLRAAHLAAAMRNFWSVHSHFTEGRKWIQSALEGSGLEIPVAVRFKLLNGLGSLTLAQGDYAATQKVCEQSLAEGKAANDLRQIAYSNRGLGLISSQQGDLAAARKFMEDSLVILRELGDKVWIARALNSLGDIERLEGNTAAARQLFEETLAICRQLNLKGDLTVSLVNIGAVSFEEGNFATSYSYFAEGLAMAQEFKDKKIISLSLEGFAALALQRGELVSAARLAGTVQHLREKIGYEPEPADRRFRDAYLSELKSKMEESDFSKFYEEGGKMKLEEAIMLITSSDY